MQALPVELEPAPLKQALAELGMCLTLVAPSGMSNDDRAEWLKVARLTLRDLPYDLLARGCAKARESCKFVSEIVPCILNELEYAWPARQAEIRHANRPQLCLPPSPPTCPSIEYVDPEEVRKLIRSIGTGAPK